MKMLENGKGQAIALIFLSLAFSAWAFVVRYAADDLGTALEKQTVVMENIREEQIEMKIEQAKIELRLSQLERDYDGHEDSNHPKD